jgi:S1-C subfamily serine protease
MTVELLTIDSGSPADQAGIPEEDLIVALGAGQEHR